MKVIIEMDQVETRKAIANGTFAALCDGIPMGAGVPAGAGIPAGAGMKAPEPDERAIAKQEPDDSAAKKEAEAAEKAAAEEAKAAAAAKKAAAKAKADAAAKAAAEAAAEAAKAAAEADGDDAGDAQTPPWGNDAGAAAGQGAAGAGEAAAGQAFTLEEVRGKLAGLNKAGKSALVKALLGEFGAAKLTEVSEDDYTALMAKAAKL